MTSNKTTSYTAKDVQSALDYDPETGMFIWRQRPRRDFASDRACNIWNGLCAGKPALTAKTQAGYAHGTFMNKRIYAHRAAFACMTGEFPAEEVDHLDGCRDNNKWGNLRAVSRAQNASNAQLRKDNTSGEVGVTFHEASGKWSAYLRRTHIGLFSDIADAVTARRLAAAIDGAFTSRHGA